MKVKKLLAYLTAAVLAVPQFTSGVIPQITSIQIASAEDASDTNAAGTYFYDQITSEAKVFYKAIQNMHDKGILKTGSGDYDMTANGDLTKEQAEAYAGGGAGVLELFGQARDAFYMDHTDIFYVDISSLSIRVTYDGNDYHVYIGTGRRDSYYAAGYTDVSQVDGLLDNYNKAVETIAAGAGKVTAGEGESLTAKQVEYVHDYLTKHTSYRLENVCKKENLGFIRTAYGALVAGEAVCEGYSRAFKAVMDELGIPCVLVNGIYQHDEDQLELHMWTEVEIDGSWYGVDVTMDDPKSPTVSYASESNGIDGYESHEYLLVGNTAMNVHHRESGSISDVNFEFSYPKLNLYNYGVKTAYDDGELSVTYDTNGELDGETVDMFYISYKGWGLEKSRENGYYFLCKMEDSDWFYIYDYDYEALVDSESVLKMPLTAQIDDVQFAVTDIPYKMDDKLGDLGIIDSFFHGTEEDMLEVSDVYYNSHGGYEPPPYPKTVTPSTTVKYYADEGILHVSITYNDTLVKVDGEKPGIILNSTGPTAIANSKIENFKWDNESTVTFDFTPSKMYADDSVYYYITLSGLVGKKSGKTPVKVTYGVSNKPTYCCPRVTGFNWNVFGQPALIDNSDISTNDWKTSDGESVDEMLKHRMVLVASSTTPEQTETMNELINEKSESKVLKSETYNINLTICEKMVISTGQGVRVSVGFPEGYGPEDAGVTFKAYHFIKNKAGEVTGVEEIPCIITEYGLIIECRSFSPFAIAAVEDDGTQSGTDKSVAVISTTGGTVSGAAGIKTLSENESITLSIQSDNGYVIESVSVDGKFIEVTDNSKMKLTVGYKDISGTSGIVDVKFTAKSVIEKEEQRGETAVEINTEAEQSKPPVEPTEPTTGTNVPTTTATSASAVTTTTAKTTTTIKTTTAKATTTSKTTTAKTTTTIKTTTAKVTTTAATTTEPILRGDISGNGNIDLMDAIIIAKYLLNPDVIAEDKMDIADFNNDGKVDLLDVIGIAKYIIWKNL